MEELYGNAGLRIEAIHPDDVEQVRRNWARQLEGHATEELFRVAGPGGSTRWVMEAGRSPVKDFPPRLGGSKRITTEKRKKPLTREVNTRGPGGNGLPVLTSKKSCLK